MKIAYTIHELVLASERVSPKSVVELDDKTFAELADLGAVRDATGDEIVIAGLTASAPAPAPAPKPTAAEKKAAAAAQKKADEEAAAAAAAAAAADPDVTEPNGEGDLLGGN